jgi:hypothetical protein
MAGTSLRFQEDASLAAPSLEEEGDELELLNSAADPPRTLTLRSSLGKQLNNGKFVYRGSIFRFSGGFLRKTQAMVNSGPFMVNKMEKRRYEDKFFN